ncbi:ABC transporter substrate-binding protein [Halorhodospira halochloris]|uniref:ABC transporter substrate-binding protein n=1 Tax=Halorhodospira halochloris TaxID=1052 RepID=UPI001EE82F0B|nr:ABC transporter substrate-binding protein [Halorhodospira halochloris]MCG5530926.1 ABC transporter substrate-binding protein [Halorhodospira halochloris]
MVTPIKGHDNLMALRNLIPLSLLTLIAAAIAFTLYMGERQAQQEQRQDLAATPGDPAERRGGLVDEIVFTVESDPGRIAAQIERGSHHLYAQGIASSTIFRQIQTSPNVEYYLSHGNTADLALNPAEFDDGSLNPFNDRAIREAMNWLIDRRYIAEEIYGGLARPRYLPIHTAFPDYALLAETARELERKYAHDPERAERIITERMQELGAERRDGQWYDGDSPVTIKVLIRTEDNRERVGDYVANRLEDLGFRIERLYRTADEATRIWIASDPAAGRWHIYTGAWVSPVIDRDAGDNLSFYYTPRGRPSALWQAYEPGAELSEIAEVLERRDFASLEERHELLERGLELAMENSARIWLIDQTSVTPHAAGIEMGADLAGGIAGSALWPFTIRFSDRVGGRLMVATPSMLTEPWNFLAGSNWIFDTMIQRGLSDAAALPDPFTGLYHPQRLEGAEVTVEEDTPIQKTLDWVTLETTEEIEVPDDAWIDWDRDSGEIIDVGTAHPDGLTARARTKLRYSEGFLDRNWHDGSQVSIADMVVPWILRFERADEESSLFDPSHLSSFEVYREHFRGWRIVDTDPLSVEIYSDQIYPDAEYLAAMRAPSFLPWHVLQLGMEAERRGELAFSSTKADQLGVEWQNLVSGPSLEILRGYLSSAAEAGRYPYPEAIDEWLREGEVEQRHQALQDWHAQRGHFWVDDGPYYLHSVRPVEGTLVLRRNKDFPDRGDKWLHFTDPRIPELDLQGPLVIEKGAGAEINLSVTYAGEPYPNQEIDSARYMLFDGDDELRLHGEAEPTAEDGRWQITIEPEKLAELGTSANSLEVTVITPNVALPSFAAHAFATVPQRADEAIDEGGDEP